MELGPSRRRPLPADRGRSAVHATNVYYRRPPSLDCPTRPTAPSLNQTFTLSQEQTLTEHSPNTGPGIPVADLSRATEQGKSERFPRGHDAMSAQQGP